MKKIVLSLICVAVICTAIAFISQTHETNILNTFSKDTTRKTVTIDIPTFSRFTADYSYSNINYQGKTIDHYKDSANNEFTLNPDGSIRSAIITQKLNSVIAKSQSKNITTVSDAKVRETAYSFVTEVADNYANYSESVFVSHGHGSEKIYDVIYNETICGFMTENSVAITLNSLGEIISFTIINDFDYSALDTNKLSTITNDTIKSFVDDEMLILHPGNNGKYDAIDSIYITKHNNKYMLHIAVTYSVPASGSRDTTEINKIQELFYEIN